MLLKDDPSLGFMPYPAVKVPAARSGPLKGLTFAVKDLFDVAGYPTSAGSPHMLAMSGIKTGHARSVQALLDAGAGFVGKTITDELAFSMNGKNAHFGAPVNGAAPDRITGGSSSGSAAAVSHGLCDFALGTDTGGSVRAPANHCGLYGLRPTHGRVSLKGAHDLAPGFDTCGWFARDAATYARVADVLLGADRRPLPAKPRLLIARDCFELLEEPVRAALAPAIGRLEALYGPATTVLSAPGGFDEIYWAFRRIQGWEAWRTDGAMIERYRPPLGPGVAERFGFSKAVTEAEHAAANEVRAGHGRPDDPPRPGRCAHSADHGRHRSTGHGRRGRSRILPQPQPEPAEPLRPRPSAAIVHAAGETPRRAARTLGHGPIRQRSQPRAHRRGDRVSLRA